MALPIVSHEFRVAQEPELRFTPSGVAMLRLNLVANSRKKNENGEWVDDKVCWLRATVWREAAEHAAETITKGMLVVVSGRMQTDEWEDEQGNKRSAMSLNVDTIGPSLKWNAFNKVESTRSTPNSAPAQSAPTSDPWGAADQPPPPF